MRPLDLIRTARRLASGRAAPREADLRRAVSTCYFAMFHAICEMTANRLAGKRGTAAWAEAYRAPLHPEARRKCEDHAAMARFPAEIRAFGDLFVQAQINRHRADYAPDCVLARSEVLNDIAAAEASIRALAKADRKALTELALYFAFAGR